MSSTVEQKPSSNSGGPGLAEGNLPRTKAPFKATDCHHHIFDPRYPSLRPVKAAPLSEYRKIQARLGMSRSVVIQGSSYGTDNRCLLDMLADLGASSRGIVSVEENVTDAKLRQLDARGVRGLRFNLRRGDAKDLQRLEALSPRILELGWHVQMNFNPDQTVGAKDILNRLPTPIVFDHMGHLTSTGLDHPAREVIDGLLQKGRAWVKLTGYYLGSKVGPPTYADAGAVVKYFVRAVPERLVWGSDWPHSTAPAEQDDAHLFDLFAQWIPDETVRTRILVDNPVRLYGFA